MYNTFMQLGELLLGKEVSMETRAKYRVGQTVKVGLGLRARVSKVTTMGHYKLEGCGDAVFSETELKAVTR